MGLLGINYVIEVVSNWHCSYKVYQQFTGKCKSILNDDLSSYYFVYFIIGVKWFNTSTLKSNVLLVYDCNANGLKFSREIDCIPLLFSLFFRFIRVLSLSTILCVWITSHPIGRSLFKHKRLLNAWFASQWSQYLLQDVTVPCLRYHTTITSRPHSHTRFNNINYTA